MINDVAKHTMKLIKQGLKILNASRSCQKDFMRFFLGRWDISAKKMFNKLSDNFNFGDFAIFCDN